MAETPADDEQITEEGGASEEEEITDVIPSDGEEDETPAEEVVDEPVVDEPTTDFEDSSDEAVESEEESEDEEELVSDKYSLNSMEAAEVVKVSVAQVALDDKDKPVSYGALTDAAISFTENTVDDDGTVNKDAKNILFKVTPVAGKKLSKLQYALGDTEEDFAFDKKPTLKNIAVNADPNAEYKVADAVKDLASKKKLVRIYVTMADVEYTVNFNKETAANSANVYLKKTDDSGDYDFDNAKSTTKVTYGGSLTFAVKGLDNAKLTAKQTDADDKTAVPLSGEEQTIEGSEPEETYLEYTLTLSDVAGLAATKDDTVKVTLDVDTKPAVALDGGNIKKNPATVAGIDFGSVGADGYKDLVAGTYYVGDKIAFTATVGNDDYALSGMLAYWVASGGDAAVESNRHALDIAEDSLTVSNESVSCYVIDLAEVTEAADLYVEVNAELNDEKDTVKTVSFAGDGHVKAVEMGGTITDEKENIIGKSQKTTGENYRFDVQADDGYTVTKIEAEISKKYDDESTGSETITIKTDGTKDDDESALYPFNDKKTITIPFSGTDEAEEEGAEGKSWTTREVKVTITTGVQTSVWDSDVTVVSRGNYSDKSLGAYTVVVKEEKDKVEKKSGNSYTVKEGTEYLEFSVTDAETEPVIKVHGDTNLAEKTDSEGFTYRVPAVSLRENDGIIVERASKNVTVNYNGHDSLYIDVEDAIKSYNLTDGEVSNAVDAEYAYKNTATVNVDAKVLVKVALASGQKAPITAVNYQIGEGSAQSAELKDGFYQFEAKASEDITVNVTKSTDKKLELTIEGDPIQPDDNGVYNVSYKDVITAKVYNGENALTLFNAVVKDENKNAATVAKLNAAKDEASITVDKSEYNKELTVTLITLDDRTPVSFKIKSETPVDSVSYGSEIADGKLSLPVDTEVTTKVTMAAGNAPLDNLGVKIVAKTAKDAKAASLTNTGVEVDLNGDELTITALPSDSKGKGKADAARIVLYDIKDTDCKIIEGSEIVVSTEDATVLGKAATVTAGTSTAKSLRVKITSPEGIREDLASGASVWYKIEVTAPKSWTGVSADVKTAVTEALKVLPVYYSKYDVDKDGGVSLQVVADTITKGSEEVAIAGAEIKGFGVKVTPVQTLNYVSGRGDIVNTQVIPGTAVDITADTQNPYYENTQAGKLKLTTLNKATVITGNTAKVAVAAPQFDKNASYTLVEASFVDMKTGRTRYPYDLAVGYNESTNAVEVWGAGSYSDGYRANFEGSYKDLGVKVTAVTEDTGYGISGTLKLNVVNGIEDIDAVAQPNVKKDANKAASFKLAVDLNESSNNTGLNPYFNSKYAPKTKTVTYEIVGTDTNGSYDKTAAPAGIAANVTVKNGTVTVAKGFVVDEKNTANNQFKVLVKAADYAGNTEEDVTGTITISSQSLSMGSLVIVKPGKGDDWTKATIVSGNKVEATRTDTCEYRAVVLQPGVGTDRDSYNVTDYTNTVINPNAFDFSPAKGGVTVDKYGRIYVTKLGKANIVATDKSDKKNKKELKAVEFVQKNTNMILELTQISDSTLEGIDHNKKFYDTNVEFSGNNTTLFGLRVVERDENGDVSEIQLSDVKLGFKKNVKNVTPKKDADWYKYGLSKNDCQYLIATTGNPGTVTFQRKGQQAVTYTLTNATYASGKAPKVTPADKKQKAIEKQTTTLTYELKSAVKGESFDGKYVILSIDNTKANPDDISKYYSWDELCYGAFGDYLDRAIAVRDGSLFDFTINPAYAKAYNLTVAVGSLKDGVFTQEYADAKLAVKVAKKGSVNLTVGGSYTLDPQVASTVKIQYKSTQTPWFVNTAVDGNYAQNAIIDNKENNFRKYFVAAYDDNGEPVIGLNDKITAKELAEITADPKNPDLTGFLSLENSGKRVDVKVTIKFKSAASLKAVTASVLSGSDMTLDIKLYNGKEYVAVKDYTIVDGAGFTKAKDAKDYLTNHIMVYNEKSKKEEISGGDIRLNGSNIPAGKATVKLMVTPLNTPALYRDDAKQAGAVPVEVKITIAKSDVKNKVTFAKGANTWVVSSTDYVGPANIKVEKGEKAPAQGIWTKDIPYTFKNALSVKENTPINVTADAKAPYVTFKSDAYSIANKNQTLTAMIDKEALAASIDGKKLKWGGKVTVTATFAYGDEKNPTTLVQDTAKITITLPKDIRSEALKADFEAVENDIQNMVETQTRHNQSNYNYRWDEDVQKAYVAESNREIHARVNDWILDVAGSATVNVSVTDNGNAQTTMFADEYTVVVTDAEKKEVYKHTFKVNAEKTVYTVISKISEKSAGNWNAVKNALDEDTRKLFTLTKDTTEAEYAAMIRNILTKSGDITNNIGITVKTAEDGYLAPKVEEAGRYNVAVYVTDKNKAPSENGYQRTVDVNYSFYPMEAAGDASTGAIGRVSDALKASTPEDKTMIGKLVDDTWKATGKTDMAIDSSEFYEALEKSILAKADELIANGGVATTGNDSLKATAIENGTFEMTTSGSNVTGMKYTLVLTDSSTEPARTQTVNVEFTRESIKVASFQTDVDLQTAVEKITSIPKAATEEAAQKEVAAKIQNLVVNPAFDKDGISVEVTKFVAPGANTAGLVSVSVKLKKDAAAFDVDNITILTTADSDFKVDDSITDEEEIAAAKVEARLIERIKTELSAARLTEMFATMQNARINNGAYVAGSDITSDKIKEEIAKIVGGTDGEKGLLADTDYELKDKSDKKANIVITATGVTEFTAPVNSTAQQKLPAFKVVLKKDDAEVEVPIAAITLAKMPEFQSFDAMKNNIVPATLTLNAIEGVSLDKEGEEIKGFSDATKFDEAVQETFISKITNPLFKVETDVSSKDGQKTSYEEPSSGNNAYVVKNWKVTITDLSNDDAKMNKFENIITTISVLKADKTSAAKAIKFTKLDDTEIASDKGGESATPAEPANKIDGTKTTVDITAEVQVTAGAEENKDDFQEMTWKVGNVTDGKPVPGVTIDENGTLTVGENVAVTNDHDLTVKVTATAVKKDARGKEVSGELYVKLSFKPQVDEFTVTGPESIELSSAGASNEIDGYKAVMEGMYLTAADQKLVKWTITDKDGKELEETVGKVEAESDASKAKVTIVDGSDLTTDGVIVKATVDNDTSWLDVENVPANTLEVALTKNASASDENAPAINLGAASGVTLDGALKDETRKVVVTGKDVRIPLSVEGQENRAWTYTLADDGAGNDLITKYGINDIKVVYSSNNKRAWLVITNNVLSTDAPDEVVPEEDDNETTPVSAKKIKLSAVAESNSGVTATMNAKDLTFALVVEQSVEGVKLYQTKADGTALDDTPDSTGTGNIRLDKSASDQKVYLLAGLEGNHISTEEAEKATYKITNKSRDLDASCTMEDGDKVVTVTIPANGVGFVEVTATYKEGTGDSATVKTAKRLIKITDASAVTAISVTSGTAGSITIDKDYDTSGNFTQRYQVKKGETVLSNVSWSVDAEGTIEDFVSIDESSGILTLKAKPTETPYLPADTYRVTVWASYDEEGIPYQKSQSVTITVKKVAKKIDVTAAVGTTSLIKTDMADGTGDNLGKKEIVLNNDTAGTLTISATLSGDRFNTADAGKLQYKVEGGESNFTPVALTDVINGSVQITIPATGLTAGKPFTVIFSVKEDSELDGAVTAEVLVTMAEAD